MNYNKEAKSLTFRRGSEVSQVYVEFRVSEFWGFRGLGFRVGLQASYNRGSVGSFGTTKTTSQQDLSYLIKVPIPCIEL